MMCFHSVLLRLPALLQSQTFLWASSRLPLLPLSSLPPPPFPSTTPPLGEDIFFEVAQTVMLSPSRLKTWNTEEMSYSRWLYFGCVFPSTNVKVEINLGNVLGISPPLSLPLYPPGSCATVICLSFQKELPGRPSSGGTGEPHVLTDAVGCAGAWGPVETSGTSLNTG